MFLSLIVSYLQAVRQFLVISGLQPSEESSETGMVHNPFQESVITSWLIVVRSTK
jgi:hypothetical protein